MVPVERKHDADPRKHRRAICFRDQDQRLIPQNRMRVKPTNRVSLRSEGARYGKRQVAARAHDRRLRDEGKKDHQKDQADDGWPTSQEGQSLRRPKGSWHAQEGQEGGEEDDRAAPLMRQMAPRLCIPKTSSERDAALESPNLTK